MHIKSLCLNFSFILVPVLSFQPSWQILINVSYVFISIYQPYHPIHTVESLVCFLPPFPQAGNGKLLGSPLPLLPCFLSLKDECRTFIKVVNAYLKASASSSTLLLLSSPVQSPQTTECESHLKWQAFTGKSFSSCLSPALYCHYFQSLGQPPLPLNHIKNKLTNKK